MAVDWMMGGVVENDGDEARSERRWGPSYDDDRPSASDFADEYLASLPVGECSACGDAPVPLQDDLCVTCWEPPTCPGCGEVAGHRGRCL